MRIEVTEQDIRRGIVSDCHFCPVALAVGRACGIAHGFNGAIRVKTDEIALFPDVSPVFGEDRLCFRWDTPPEVEEFMMLFDDGVTVLPFTFELAGGNGHSRSRELRAALDDEDEALRRPGTMENVFLADAVVQSRKMAERDLWAWAGWKDGEQ